MHISSQLNTRKKHDVALFFRKHLSHESALTPAMEGIFNYQKFEVKFFEIKKWSTSPIFCGVLLGRN